MSHFRNVLRRMTVRSAEGKLMKLGLYISLAWIFIASGTLIFSDASEPTESYEHVYRYMPDDLLSIREGHWKGYVVYLKRVSGQSRIADELSSEFQKGYPIEDLPFWSRDGKVFDATLLVSVIQTHVAPESWGKRSSINMDGTMLVVTASNENHLEIDRFLKRFRTEQ